MQKLLKNMLQTRSGTCIKLGLFAILLFAFYFSCSAQVVFAQEWTIDNFDSEIVINSDATITVTEVIEVNFDTQKHGIYRDLPIRYEDEYGNSYKTDLDVIDVKQDGEDAQVSYEYGYSFLTLQIGDPDETITGTHSYVITYSVDRVFLYFEDYDEFYWNVSGTAWEVPVLHSSATIYLPQGAEFIQGACYTGEYGSTSKDCVMQNDGSAVYFSADDFLTIAVGFEKGFIYEPTESERFWIMIGDNWPGVLPIILLTIALFIWIKHGKDTKINQAIVAQYEPPKGMKAVYAGAIVCGGQLKSDHMSAMIIQLAVDGYLKIDVQEKEKLAGIFKQNPVITLTPIKSSVGLDSAHALYHDMLFKGRMEAITLNNIKRAIKPGDIKELKRKIQQQLFDDQYYIKKSSAYSVAVLFAGVIMITAGIILGSRYGLFVILSCVICGILICILGALTRKPTQKGAEARWYLLGFKDFMHTAERYRSEWQEKENIFAQYLPYAIAFNDVKKWAKTFEGIQQEKPDWYSGNTALLVLASSGRFDSVSNAVKSSTLPGSSGSGGGGHSGGGFGGGGGGSW